MHKLGEKLGKQAGPLTLGAGLLLGGAMLAGMQYSTEKQVRENLDQIADDQENEKKYGEKALVRRGEGAINNFTNNVEENVIEKKRLEVNTRPRYEASPNSFTDRKTPFILSEYSIPAEGMELDQKVYVDSEKTVIYIPDYHANQTLPSSYQTAVQKQIFAIVEDLKEKYGKVPLVLETWPEGVSLNDFRITTDHGYFLKTVLREPDIGKRLTIVDEKVWGTAKFAGPVLAITFRETVFPIGTYTDEDQKLGKDNMRKDRKLRAVIRGERNFCTGLNGQSYDFMQVQKDFVANGSENTTHCYCAVSGIEDEVFGYVRERLKTVPVREVNTAVSVDSDLVVLVTGARHWPYAKKELDKRGVSYSLVAALKYADRARSDFDNNYLTDSSYPDMNGRCNKMMSENRGLVDDARSEILK